MDNEQKIIAEQYWLSQKLGNRKTITESIVEDFLKPIIMENKELPNLIEYWCKKNNVSKDSELIQNGRIIEFTSLEVLEYAKLVAEYRSEQSLIEANNRMIDQAFKLGIHKQLIESLEMAILNAYKV